MNNSKSKAPFKILKLVSVYPRSQDDSEVPWMRETVNRLVESGIEVDVLAPSWKGLSSHKIDGVQVHRFRYAIASWEFLTHDEGAPSKLARNPLFQLLAVPYVIIGACMMLNLMRKNKYDILHVHWPFPHGLMALPTQWLFKVPVILNFHGASLLLQRKFRFVRPCLDFVIKHAQGIVTNSSFTRAKVHEIRDVDVMLSPYGSPLENLNLEEVNKLQTSDEPTFKLLFVGRHIERKGIEYLIEAFRILAESQPEIMKSIQLDIVGGGESTERLKILAGKTPHLPINFPGKVSNEELSEYYRQADVFVLPSIIDSKGDTEGLGVVLIEAIQSDTAIIASEVGGIVDVVVHRETGLLVPEKNPQAIVDAILQLKDDEKLRQNLCEGARNRAQEFFDWDGIIQRLIVKYEEVLNPHSD